jgi:hypothetical protein
MNGGLSPISSSWRQFHWDSRPVILFYNWSLAVIVLLEHPLSRQDGSVVYNFCWASPAQSFSGPSPAGLMTTFYCLRLETPITWSKSKLLYDWRFTANQFVYATSPLRLTTSNFIFQLNICRYSPSVTSSVRIRWVCRLQLLLGLASAVILRSESRETHDHILISESRLPQPGGPGPHIYIPRE